MILSAGSYLVLCFHLSAWSQYPFYVWIATSLLCHLEWWALHGSFAWELYPVMTRILANMEGCLLGWLLLVLTNPPRLLAWNKSHQTAWGLAAVWLVYHLTAETCLVLFPPIHTVWGLVGRAGGQIIGHWTVVMCLVNSAPLMHSPQRKAFAFSWVWPATYMSVLLISGLETVAVVFAAVTMTGFQLLEVHKPQTDRVRAE